jgi:hypothetical protein
VIRALLHVFFAAPLGACIGMNVSASRVEHPVSASAHVFDENHAVLGDEHLETVHGFELERSRWALLYSAIRLSSGEWDLSDELDALIAQHGGEAITNLELHTRPCAINYVIPLSFLPFWPSCASFTVTGTVVRRRAGVSAPPPPAAAPATVATSPPGAPAPPSMVQPAPPAPAPAAAAPAPAGGPPSMVSAAPAPPQMAPPPVDAAAAAADEEQDDDRTGSYGVFSLGLGNCTGDCDSANSPGFGFTIEYHYRLLSNVSAGVGVQTLWPSRSSVLAIVGTGRYHLLARGAIDFWVGFSAGYASFWVENTDASWEGLALAPSIGLEYWAGPHVVAGPRLTLLAPIWSDLCAEAGGVEMCADPSPLVWVLGVELRFSPEFFSRN